MNAIKKNIFHTILCCLSVLLLDSCITPSRNFTETQQRENNRRFMLQQKQQEEELARERLRIKANQALSIAVSNLTVELHNKLGKGETAQNDFKQENISYYYYPDISADCPTTIWWNRKQKDIVISGNLIYQNNGYVKFVCTDASNTRPFDKSYIRKLATESLYFKVH